jgi:hypothetical protein
MNGVGYLNALKFKRKTKTKPSVNSQHLLDQKKRNHVVVPLLTTLWKNIQPSGICVSNGRSCWKLLRLSVTENFEAQEQIVGVCSVYLYSSPATITLHLTA